MSLHPLIAEIAALPDRSAYGRVTGGHGDLAEIAAPPSCLHLGARGRIVSSLPGRGGDADDDGSPGDGPGYEIVGFRNDRGLAIVDDGVGDIALQSPVLCTASESVLFPCDAWRGRVLDPRGVPLDGGSAPGRGSRGYALRGRVPTPDERRLHGDRLRFGVRALDLFTPAHAGQRLGIFAAAGVGKTVLLSMLMRNVEADVVIYGLVGERGREVADLMSHCREGALADRLIVVAATSDRSALMRRDAAYAALAIAESFRDRGLHALCLIDSITRLAGALREIGLSCGESPAARGYPPSVFSQMPRLLERAGGLRKGGAATALFSVLVEGDDHDEPIADALRGFLDGHIVLSRAVAESGRHPAVDVLRSLSRTAHRDPDPERLARIAETRKALRLYEDMAELIRLGAYRKGTDPETDAAIRIHEGVENLLRQPIDENADPDLAFDRLKDILEKSDS